MSTAVGQVFPEGNCRVVIVYDMPRKVVNIVDETSPTIKRSRTAMPPVTGMSDMAGVPRLVLRDFTKMNYVVSDDNTLWYKNADRFIQIKPFEVKIRVERPQV